jgi:hypothetical protein
MQRRDNISDYVPPTHRPEWIWMGDPSNGFYYPWFYDSPNPWNEGPGEAEVSSSHFRYCCMEGASVHALRDRLLHGIYRVIYPILPRPSLLSGKAHRYWRIQFLSFTYHERCWFLRPIGMCPSLCRIAFTESNQGSWISSRPNRCTKRIHPIEYRVRSAHLWMDRYRKRSGNNCFLRPLRLL